MGIYFSQDLIMSEYPKITQEALTDAAKVILNTLKNPQYITGAPYSSLMVKTINEVVANFRSEIQSGLISSTNPQSGDSEAETLLAADIENQFATLNENLDQRSSDYQDNYRLLVRVERTIRSLEKIATSGSSDTVKMSATAKLMDFQDQQLDILERLMNLEKAQKIESVTRRFFHEIRKYDDLKSIADRYLELLKEID